MTDPIADLWAQQHRDAAPLDTEGGVPPHYAPTLL